MKKYGKKLRPYLEKRYGKLDQYTASQIRATVYQCDFNPKHLPLGYLLFLDKTSLQAVVKREFPDLCIESYERETNEFLSKKNYLNYLSLLNHST